MTRTTIDLPDDLHHVVLSIARERHATFSATIADLLRKMLSPPASDEITFDPQTGLPMVQLGRAVTSEDVRSLDDEQ